MTRRLMRPMLRWLAVMASAGLVWACLPEFPAEPPEPLPDPDAAMPEPEPDGAPPEPEPEPEPEADMMPPEPDAGPMPETCNQADDDFDGLIDEGFGLNQPCVDGADRCGVTVCAEDGADVACVAPEDGRARADEACNAIDDDCDGTVDEGFDVAVECTVGQGVCETFGLQVCAEDGAGTVCDAMPGEGEDEFCNDLDDDCDGSTDEGDVCD